MAPAYDPTTQPFDEPMRHANTARPMTEKLEPCPFCGGPGELGAAFSEHGKFAVRCWGDDCWRAPMQYGATKQEAAANWNRRSTSAAVRGMREAAQALNDEVDRMWNDVHRFNPPSWESHAKAICAAQQRLYAALSSKGEG